MFQSTATLDRDAVRNKVLLFGAIFLASPSRGSPSNVLRFSVLASSVRFC